MSDEAFPLLEKVTGWVEAKQPELGLLFCMNSVILLESHLRKRIPQGGFCLGGLFRVMHSIAGLVIK